MGLADQLRSINSEVVQKKDLPPIIRTLPSNEVQQQIKKACSPGMHYPEAFSVIGKLVSGGICHDDLIANSHFFDQYISADSDTLSSKSVEDLINDHRRSYGDQVGSRVTYELPADCFSAAVYDNLPHQLSDILKLLSNEPRKRDVCLIGMITALSAAFTRFRFFHGSGSDVKEYSPHLITLVVGSAGSGKGLTRYGATIVGSIIHRATEMKKEALSRYKKLKEEYDRETRQRVKDKQSTEDLVEPVKPPKYCFGMSASDTTQAALVEVLNENPAGGFAYDSEVDTLVQGNANKEFGGFSDVIRKVFHHEPLHRQRKGEHESYIVEQPRLAVMLSGTHDQLRKLIPSEYNGLFSRIWYYSIPKTFIPYTQGSLQEDIIGEKCYTLQSEIFERANLWSDELVYFKFSEQQEQEIYEAMQDKQDIEEKHGGDIGASWLRMALIVKRIAVTLAAMQRSDEIMVPENCWRAAMALLPAIKSHCLQVLEVIRMNQGKKFVPKEKYELLKNTGLTDKEIGMILGVDDRTLRRYKKKWD